MKKNIIFNTLCGFLGLTNCFANNMNVNQEKTFTITEIVESLIKHEEQIVDMNKLRSEDQKTRLVTAILPSSTRKLNLNNNTSIKLYDELYDYETDSIIIKQIPLQVNVVFPANSSIVERLNIHLKTPKFIGDPDISITEPFSANIDLGIGEIINAKFSKPTKFINYNDSRSALSSSNIPEKISFKEKGQPVFHSFKVTGAETTGDKTLKKIFFDAKVQLWCKYKNEYYRGMSIMSAYFYTINDLLEKVEPLDLTKYHVAKEDFNKLLSIVTSNDSTSEVEITYEMQPGQFVSKDGFVYNHDGKPYMDYDGNAVKLKILEGATPDIEIVTSNDSIISYPCDIKVSGTLGEAILSIDPIDENGTFETKKFNLTNAYTGNSSIERLMCGPVEFTRTNDLTDAEESIHVIFNNISNTGLVDVDPNTGTISRLLSPSLTTKTTINKSGKFIDSVFAVVNNPSDTETDTEE